MQQKWLFVIRPKTKLIDLNLKEVWQYRDLLMLFVKRDVITLYKQTILGPLLFHTTFIYLCDFYFGI